MAHSKSVIEKISSAVNDNIENMCGGIAKVVTKHPRKTIATQYALTVLCCLGFANLQYDNLPERLYVPQDTEAFKDRDFVEANYGFTPSESQILIDGKTNLLARGPLRDLFDLHDTIMDIEAVHGKYAYDERYCYFKDGVCQRSGILAFWDWNRTKFEADGDLVATVNRVDVPNRHLTREAFVDLRNVASGYARDENGTVVGFTKLLVYYQLGIHLRVAPRRFFFSFSET